MYTLLDFKEEALAEYLNSALRKHGLDSHVFNTGVSAADSPEISHPHYPLWAYKGRR